ncbi:hypothetical protein [Inmirania thermothiophila]|uniref:ABC-type uncharacterized transport system substrate-binding protein n=1 Tax=Inmirania thermothiophila TaxID=1750597 RepID=A0A3N1Y4C9_9GAMM|nr:hypothetical protein [Inmirania thermothiophila]ROR32137.1 ABC-type uncharacterized transport system substrate-binding protein [Inmirania thermothiophila]
MAAPLRLPAALVLLVAAAAAPAAQVAVWGGGDAAARETAALVEAALRTGGHEPVADAPGTVRAGAAAYVVLGRDALAGIATLPPALPVVAGLVPRADAEAVVARLPPPRRHRLWIVTTEQPPARILRLAALALPEARHVGVLLGPRSGAARAAVEAAARALGRVPRIGLVPDAGALIPVLDELLPEVSVLALLPDPVVVNRVGIRPLLLRAYRAGVPVVGPSRALVRAGAVAGVFSGPEEMAGELAALVEAALAGKAPDPGPRPPRRFDVVVNPYVAHALGLTLPGAPVLARELRELEEREVGAL